MTPLRYVIVGTGGFGAFWCANVLPRLAELGKAVPVAAVDRDPAMHAVPREHLGLGAEQCYTDAREALARHPADFLVIVVPPAYHEHYVDLALQHGLHVLSEKPLADTMAGSVRIVDKVRAAGVKMAVTMSHRFADDKQTLARAVRSGAYGPLQYLVVRFTVNSRAFASWGEFRHRMADPLVIEGAVHHFDVLREIAGADARSVQGLSWNPPWGEYAGDSTGLYLIEMENGVRCLYEGAKANAATLSGWGHEYIRAECEHATLVLDERRVRVLRSDGWLPPEEEPLPLAEGDAWMNAWIAERFCDWLAGGPAPPTTAEDNLQCAALTFAAVEAARSRTIVDVPSFLAAARDAGA